MEIKLNIDSCRACPRSTNSSKEHDCAFTSAPYPTFWWCVENNGPDSITDPEVIHVGCPLKG